MVDSSNFNFSTLLYESNSVKVYRGFRISDKKPLIFKILKNENQDKTLTDNFKREFSILQELTLDGVSDGVIRECGLESYDNTIMMVLEDIGGRSLGSILQEKKLLVEEFLNFAVKLCSILDSLYKKQIIHKDINPHNIIWNEESDQIELIDFGIATRTSTRSQSFTPLETIEGTIAYISPEQTGRMNRAVDHRTDLYSLGVTFYEMISGQHPFNFSDPMEIIHAHLAQIPMPVATVEDSIPEYISTIIEKLMSKMAEDRYQTFSGLLFDLQESLKILRGKKDASQFILGEKDFAERFQIPQKLYGRKLETEILGTSFEKMTNGKSELLLVKGYSGVGKSSIIYELHKNLTEKDGYFLEGKFDQFQKNTPYSAWIGAFEGFIKYLLMEGDEKLNYWKKRILDTVKQEGKVLTDVIPNLELIIGLQPDIPELGTQESQNRFNYIMMNFIEAIAQIEHPIIIFLDDLQWMDTPSLGLLELIVGNREINYLNIIGAYRDNEVDEAHPLQSAINRIETKGVTVDSITLKNLKQDDIELLLSETLLTPLSTVGELGTLIYSKTEGNPFFTHQILHSMERKKVISFDSKSSQWQWDLQKIKALDISDNVIELLVERLTALPKEMQNILKLASFIGNHFSEKMITIISELPKIEVETTLQAAVDEGVLFIIKEEYKFVHDRIQQASFTLTKESERAEIHWRVGNLLLQRLSTKQREDKLFDIANHLLFGKELISSDSERAMVLAILLDAAQKAKKANAYDLAIRFLDSGISDISSESWVNGYEQSLFFYNERAEIGFLTKDYSRMESCAEVVFSQSKTPEDRISAYNTLIQAYIGRNESKAAIETALKALESLGLSLVENPEEGDIGAAFGRVAKLRAEVGDTELINLPEMREKRDLAIVHMLASIIAPTYNTNPPLMLLTVLKMVEISIEKGNAPISAIGYSMYGLFISGMMGDYDGAYTLGELALAITDKQSGQIVHPRVLHLVNCFIFHWKQPARNSLPAFIQAYEQGLIVGDHEFASHALTNYCMSGFSTGNDLHQLKKDVQLYSEIIGDRLKQESIRSFLSIIHQTVLNLTSSNLDSISILDGEGCNEFSLLKSFQKENNATGISLLFSHKLFLQYHFEKYEDAFDSIEEATPFIAGMMGLNISVLFLFYNSLTLLELSKNSDSDKRELLLKRVSENQEKMKVWSDNAPMNNAHKFALIEAVSADLEGEFEKAEVLYETAIEGARKNQFIQEEALANELYGKYWIKRKRIKVAKLYITEAMVLYKSWGASAKVLYLQQQYPQLLQVNFTVDSTHSETGTLTNIVDVDTILKSTYTLSEEIVLDELLRKMLKIVMENAGAEEGFLLLEKGNEWMVEAEISVNQPTIKTLHSLPLNSDENLVEPFICREIINYVLRTQKSVVLSDATHNKEFSQSRYIQKKQPKSILTIPLLHHKEVKGIIYLENNLATNAFTKDHLNILQLLSAEMAISIQNAQLYSTLQQKNEELLLSTQKAQEASKVKSDFLANLSHEIRTPMNAIVGITNFLLEEDLPESVTSFVEDIHSNTSSLMNIVNHILDFSDVESGNLTLKESPTNLKTLLSSIEELFNSMAKSKGLTAESTIDKDVPTTILCDPARIRQALVSLIDNAVKFTFKGSVSLKVSVKNGELIFALIDTGIGIDKKQCDIIFKSFTQADSSTTRQYGGLGLGLTLVKEISLLMSGSITVSSVPQKGSTFTFSVPVTILTEDVKEPQKGAIKERSNLRILVAEDNLMNQKIILKILKRMNFINTSVANNGEEVISQLIENEFDLVLMDCQMPLMDGYQATKMVRNSTHHKINSSIPIIAITANAMPGDREKCINIGMDDYLSKPVDFKELEAKITQWTGVK